jgi:uncharacterized protein (TIGR03083 family)
LTVEVARFSNVMSELSLDQDVATCPGWSVLDLAEHLGVIHRWAEELVRRRSPVRLARASSDDVRVAVSPEWISAGGERLVATLLDANPNDEMWAWGLDQHVRFWSRRQLHETLVHRMDLELVAGIEPVADPATAIDAIDEYLSNLEKVARTSPGLSNLRGRGETLAFRVRKPATLWSVTFEEDGFSVSKVDGAFDAELVASPVELLLVMLGRRGVARSDTSVIGDPHLIDFWLTHSAFD